MKKLLLALVASLCLAHLCAPSIYAQAVIAEETAVAVETPIAQTLAARYLDAAIKFCDVTVRTDMEVYTSVGETIAQRHLKGGIIDLPFVDQPLMPELHGRSGGIMHIGAGRGWKKADERTDEEKANDVAIFGWSQVPHHNDIATITKLKEQGVYIVGIGPRDMQGMDDIIPLCDAFLPAGTGRDTILVDDAGVRVGRFNDFAVTIAGWTLTGEIVGALTREGKMPTMWKSWAYPDGREWSDKYFGKQQFHDDFTVRPYKEGEIAGLFLDEAIALLKHVRETEVPDIRKAADLIAAEAKADKKTVAAWAGHMPQQYLGRYEDKRWAYVREVHASLDSQMATYASTTEDGALVLRVGYQGLSEKIVKIMREKHQRLILMAGRHTDPAFAIPEDALVHIDMGYELGDAMVPIDGYPIRLFPPSGFMQAAVYNAIDVEVQQRLGKAE
jgi:hypothetical protein